MGLVSELRRRNVIRVAIAYAVAAWLLIEVTATTFPMLRLPEWTATFVAVLLMIGFPMALIFAWAFELTPEGIKLEKHVVRDESTTRFTGRKLDFFIIGLLVAALGYFAFDKFVLDPSRDAELVQTTAEAVVEKVNETRNLGTVDSSIAVLPFVNMSSDPEQEYFSDGISEELLNVLSKLPGLQVAARTSSFQFKGENRDIIDIGRRLNAALVLEGSVRKAGLQVRITAQLIDAKTGFHLWSETYDRELKDIFAVQDEISVAIVEALKEHLGLQLEEIPRAIAAANTEAHEAYLRGRYLIIQRTRATVEAAVREFEKAIVLDPDYALAHAELAIATLFLTIYGELTVTEAVSTAAPHAERAMAINPALAEAHAATGYLLRFQGNMEGALTHFRRAIQINPNYAIVYNGMAVALSFLGHYKENFAMIEMALQLDPLSNPTIGNYTYRLRDRNRLAEADRVLEKLVSIHPAFYALIQGDLTSVDGKWANAVLGHLDALRLEPDSLAVRSELTLQLAILGLEKEAFANSERPPTAALSWLGKSEDAVTTADARLAEDPTSYTARLDLGLALAGAGDFARARPILEEMWQLHGKRITQYQGFQIADGAALIVIRRSAGEDDEVDELVAAIRDNVRRYHEAGITNGPMWYSVDYEEGLADFLAGDRERGLALIAKGAEDGYFIPQSEAYLQTLYDNPGFAPIRAGQEARQARERGRFLAVVCNDNPYAAIWQPVEGTCERFAATRAK